MYSLETAKSLTNGGRALNAIWQNTKLSAFERLVLLYLGSQADFTSDFTEARWVPISRLCKTTGISRASIFRVINDLLDNGYITRQNRFSEVGQLANSYAITDKIFQEYGQVLQSSTPSHSETPPSHSETPPSHSETPPVSHRDPPPSHSETRSSLSVAPSETPSNFLTRQQSLLKKEARQIGRHLFMPISIRTMPGEYSKQKQFVDQQAVDRCMENCLKDFGIDVLKRLEQQYIEKAGNLPFDPGLIRQVCRQIASDQSH